MVEAPDLVHTTKRLNEPEEEHDSPGDQEEQEGDWEEEEDEESVDLPAGEEVPELESDDFSDADPEELMEAYFQGVRAHRRLEKMASKAKAKEEAKVPEREEPLRTERREVFAKTVDSLGIGVVILSVPRFAQARPDLSVRKAARVADKDPMESSW